jgi:MATE family multidrug resistance protein
MSHAPAVHLKDMLRKSLNLAWPTTTARVFVAINNFFAMWLLGSLGGDELAAGALIFTLQTAIAVILGSILFAISPIVARAYGAGESLKIGAVVQQGWLLSIFLSLIAAIILWFCNPLLHVLGQEPTLITIATSYFHIYIWTLLPMFLGTTNQMFLIGIGKQRLAMTASCASTLVLIPTSYALSLGAWGLPALGIAGITYGLIASIWSSFLFSSFFIATQKYFTPFALFKWRLNSSWPYLKQFFVTGWPIFIQTSSELCSWFIIVMLIGKLGEIALSAQQITNQIGIFIIIPIMGLTQASSVLIGQAAGAKNYHEVHSLGLTNIGIGIFLMIWVMVLYLGFPKALVQFYIHNTINADTNQISKLAAIIFGISAFTMLFDTIRNITIGCLRGLYDNKYPMYLNLIMTWLIGVPLSYILGFPVHLGLVGFALGSLTTTFIASLMLVWRWYKHSHLLIASAEVHDQGIKA